MASRVAQLASASTLALILSFTGAGLGLTTAGAQNPPYDVFPAADSPYYRVRYEAGTQPGELIFPVSYTIWIPPGVTTLRGVVVHQHGCGEGSCASGLTAAYDLHWQALARRHECALLGPSYEQPEKADCQMWCDPRNGSAAAFQRALADLGKASGHPELVSVPWAIWGHSGGGHWCGGMVMLFPERVAAAWLRSGVPLLEADPARAHIQPHTLPDAARGVPIMCNLGTQEGVTVKDGPFAGVWPANERFFQAVRGKGGLVGVAVDPLSSHECGNQRYLAIPWLDACLTRRLPAEPGGALRPMPTDTAWLGPITGGEASPAATSGAPLTAAWLPNGEIAKKWMQYVADTAVADDSPPPAPRNVRVAVAISPSATSPSASASVMLTWEPLADLESGLAGFVVERDGEVLARLPQDPKNPFGRPVFQNLQYSDTPTQPLVEPRFTDSAPQRGVKHVYRIRTVNTAGLESPLSAPGRAEPWPQWRGPRGDGIATETDLPGTWSKSKNVAWRTPLPGRAGATPCVWGERIYLTSNDESGADSSGRGGDDLVLLAIDTADGRIAWKRRVTGGNTDARSGEGNSASPSPSTDGEHIWTFFSTGVLSCHDRDGNEVWKFDVGDRFGRLDIQFGMTSTPVLDGGALYLQLIHGAMVLGDQTRTGKVIKLDARTGATIWAVDRITDAQFECKHSYASPCLYRHDGREFLVVHGADCTTGHALADGREVWRFGGLNGPTATNPKPHDNTFRFVASPVTVPGTIILPTCKGGPTVALAVTAELAGDCSDRQSVIRWINPLSPDVSIPLVADGLVYMLHKDGKLQCVDLATGTDVYLERTHTGQHRSSPVLAGGRLQYGSNDGWLTLVQPGREFALLGSIDFGEAITASLAVSGGTLYVRSYEALYAIRNR